MTTLIGVRHVSSLGPVPRDCTNLTFALCPKDRGSSRAQGHTVRRNLLGDDSSVLPSAAVVERGEGTSEGPHRE